MTDRPSDGGARTPTQPGYDAPGRRRRASQRESIGEAMAKSFIRSLAASLGRAIVRMINGRMR
jgi:hypothetical protein